MAMGWGSVADHVVVVALEALPGSTSEVRHLDGSEAVLKGDLGERDQ